MNIRANIMFFIEHLCDMAQREKAFVWVTNIQRDIIRIIDAVAPIDSSGANVKVVRKVSSPFLLETLPPVRHERDKT